jgi:hypothetical protein
MKTLLDKLVGTPSKSKPVKPTQTINLFEEEKAGRSTIFTEKPKPRPHSNLELLYLSLKTPAGKPKASFDSPFAPPLLKQIRMQSQLPLSKPSPQVPPVVLSGNTGSSLKSNDVMIPSKNENLPGQVSIPSQLPK